MTETAHPITLQVFTRVPVVGRVKTRLIPTLGAVGAAGLHRLLAERTLAAVRMLVGSSAAMANASVWRELWVAGESRHAWVLRQRAMDAALAVHQQPAGELGHRMHTALTHACRRGHGILIGTDCPGIDAAYLLAAIQALQAGADVVLGPVEDGGYVLIGLRRSAPELFSDMPWSTAAVFNATLARAERLRMKAHVLPRLWDVDRPEDVDRLRRLGDSVLAAGAGAGADSGPPDAA